MQIVPETFFTRTHLIPKEIFNPPENETVKCGRGEYTSNDTGDCVGPECRLMTSVQTIGFLSPLSVNIALCTGTKN
jgi:hypothetical protein